jgi:hypothetical protein
MSRTHRTLVEQPDQGDGVRRFVRFEFDLKGGQVSNCCIQYELEVNGIHGHIKRFDDTSGGFHEHCVGWPACPTWPKTFIQGVSPNSMIAYARAQIKANARQWETEVLGALVQGREEYP